MGSSRDRQLVCDLAAALRERVLPHLGSHAARAHLPAGGGPESEGDVAFALDVSAEELLEQFVADRCPDLAFYSEHRGLVEPAGRSPRAVLVVDPVDGTRPALAGFEAACVSVALAPLGDGEPTMSQVVVGCVLEIKTGHRFVAERAAGLESTVPVRLSENTDLGRLFWTYGLRGRPARPTIAVLEELIDGSSVGGATFELGSAAYDMTRVITGQLDAYVEPGPRLVDEVPGMRAEFEHVGSGSVLNNSPYDLAAAALCLSEAGALLTDAAGRSLDDRPLLGSGPDHQLSVVASANMELHRRVLDAVQRGIERLARDSREGAP